jgi:hypothetical protein
VATHSCVTVVAVTIVAYAGVPSASADITPIGSFVGDASDNFDQHTTIMTEQSLPVFDSMGTLENLSAGGAIKVEFSSQFLGHQVVSITGMMAGQLGVAQWVFNTPAVRFGGMWENNSGTDDATVEFYDVNDNLIDTVIADVPFGVGWTWNGWESDVPFTRIVVTGNGVVNGFLWYENMQVTFVPAPPAGAMLLLAAFGSRRRRR